jgi:N-methylhydantoinase A
LTSGPVNGRAGPRFRVGMDSGGTFTDIVVLDFETEQWKLHKVLSQHENPAAVLRAALDKASTGAGMGISEFIEQTEMMIIGTTVATNALLQHRGAKTGLLATRGHADVIEIREGHKEDGHRYDWDYPQATMLVPRRLRMEVTERVLADGTVYAPIVLEDVEQAADVFRKHGVETVALSFLWSFLQPSHEQAAVRLLEERLPGVRVSVSHELLPMVGYYNRVSTIVLNAYLQPVVARFVEGMEAALAAVGFTGPVRYFQANGGMSSGEAIIRKAVYALNSGPAAAPTAGAAFSRMYGKDVITIDAGGTSLDVGLVRGSQTDTSLTSDVARYRIGIPMVHIETLGAGGGSIAWFDSRGVLSVGPQSAESRPGPACYGLGGMEPTVTDALVVLGWFSQKALLGGEMPIDARAAFDAVEARICPIAGLGVDEAAEGIIRVVTNNMVGGIRRISVERGYDPRDAVLVAVGGSGPAFGCRIAEELEMDTVVVPRVASGFCAFGAALSEVRQDYVATHTVVVETEAREAGHLARLNELLESMEARGREELRMDGVDEETIELRRAFEMRYVDQVHNCLVRCDFDGPLGIEELDRLRAAFDAHHEELYTYSEPENQALLVNLQVSVIGNAASKREEKVFAPALGGGRPQDADRSREVYIASRAARLPVPVVGFDDVAAASVAGPAVIEEITTTIVVPEGWTAYLDPRGHYELRRALTPDGRPRPPSSS